MVGQGYFWRARNVRLFLLNFDSSQYARVDGSFETAARTFSVDQNLSASAVGPQENRIIIILFLRMARLPFHHFQELL